MVERNSSLIRLARFKKYIFIFYSGVICDAIFAMANISIDATDILFEKLNLFKPFELTQN